MSPWQPVLHQKFQLDVLGTRLSGALGHGPWAMQQTSWVDIPGEADFNNLCPT